MKSITEPAASGPRDTNPPTPGRGGPTARALAALAAVLLIGGCATEGGLFRRKKKSPPPAPAVVEAAGGRLSRHPDGRIVLELSGTPAQRGLQQGTLLGAEIAESLRALERLAGEDWPSLKRSAVRLVRPQLVPAQRTEIDAMAAAAHVPPDALLALNAWEDLLDGYVAPEGAPRTSSGGGAVAGKRGFVFVEAELALPLALAHLPRVTQFQSPAGGVGWITEALPGQIRSASGFYVSSAGIVLIAGPVPAQPLDRLGTPAALRAHAAIATARSASQLVDTFAERATTTRGGRWLVVDAERRELLELDGAARAPLVSRAPLGRRVLPRLPGGPPRSGALRATLGEGALALDQRRGDTWLPLSARGNLPSMKIIGTVKRGEMAGGGLELHAEGGDVYELEGAVADIVAGQKYELEGRVIEDAMSITMRGPRLRVERARKK